MAPGDRLARALRQLGSLGSEGALRARRALRHGGADAQAHGGGAPGGAALRPWARSVVARQGRSIRSPCRWRRPPLRLRGPEYPVDPRTGAGQLRRRDARQRLRRADLHPLRRIAAEALTARDAVQLLYVPVSIPPREGAGFRRRAPPLAAGRHHGAGGRLAVFLRRLAADLSAAAARLDRGQFRARPADGGSPAPPQHWQPWGGAQSGGAVLF